MNDHWDIFTNDIEVQYLKSYSLVSQKFTLLYASKYIIICTILPLSSLILLLIDT